MVRKPRNKDRANAAFCQFGRWYRWRRECAGGPPRPVAGRVGGATGRGAGSRCCVGSGRGKGLKLGALAPLRPLAVPVLAATNAATPEAHPCTPATFRCDVRGPSPAFGPGGLSTLLYYCLSLTWLESEKPKNPDAWAYAGARSRAYAGGLSPCGHVLTVNGGQGATMPRRCCVKCCSQHRQNAWAQGCSTPDQRP
jgi:hypothetical protein